MIGERIELPGMVSEYKYLPDPGSWDNLTQTVNGQFMMMRDDPASMILYDAKARLAHPLNRVGIMWERASYGEGKKKFPRPYIFDWKDDAEKRSGRFGSKLVSSGETVLITYLDGNIYTPIVLGAIESFAIPAQTAFLQMNLDDLERECERYDNDDYTLEMEKDGKGGVSIVLTGKTENNGHVSVTVTGPGTGGTISVQTNRAVTFDQIADDGKTQQRIVIDRTTNKIRLVQLEEDAEVQHVEMTPGGGIKLRGKTQNKNEYAVYGETLKNLLTDLLGALENMTFSNGGGITGPPNNIAALTAVKNTLSEILVD